MNKLFNWYFNLCRQEGLELRKAERLSPKFWHKDFLVLRFINTNIRAVVEKFHLTNKTILDLGSSHKPYQELFQASEYFGVDFSDDPAVDKKADLNNPLNLERQFDVVVSFDTLEHVLNTVEILNTIHRHMKPEARAIITTPFLFGIHDAPFDYHRFTEFFYKDIPHEGLEMEILERSTTYPASLVVHQNYFFYRLPIPYFLKFPLYLLVNIFAVLVDWVCRQIAKLQVHWLTKFLWSGPLEYFVVLKRK